MNEISIDTSAIIAFYQQRAPPAVRRHLQESSTCIPMPAYAELARYFMKRDLEVWRKIKDDLEPARVLPLDRETCELAAEVSRRRGSLSAMDSLIYACAARNGMPLLTMDADFRGRKGAIVVNNHGLKAALGNSALRGPGKPPESFRSGVSAT